MSDRVVTTGLRAALTVALAFGQAAAVGPARGEDAPLGPPDFAVGRSLRVDGAHALHSASLDFDVYRTSVEPDLADLRVFDGAGEPLPHAIRHAVPTPIPEARLEPVPVLFLDPDPADEASAGGYRIDAEVSPSGAILHLGAEAPPRLPGPATTGAWLVDASALESETIVALALDLALAPSAGNFIGYLRVAASDDLTHFRTVVRRAAVARFERSGHQIERLELELPATRARYLKLTLVEGILPADLQSVTARLASLPASPALQHTRVEGEPVEGEPGAFVYDVGAHLPVERIDVVPGEPNTLLEVRIETGDEPEGPWTRRYTGLVYRLESGDTLRSDPIPWRRGHRYVRLVASPKGGGQQRAAPTIDLGWRPGQLLFVARGEGPYVLAVGKRGAKSVAFRADELVRIAGEEARRLDDATTALGPPIALAGDAAFEEPREPVSWRRIGLWGVLVVAVGVVLALSARLIRKDRITRDRSAA